MSPSSHPIPWWQGDRCHATGNQNPSQAAMRSSDPSLSETLIKPTKGPRSREEKNHGCRSFTPSAPARLFRTKQSSRNAAQSKAGSNNNRLSRSLPFLVIFSQASLSLRSKIYLTVASAIMLAIIVFCISVLAFRAYAVNPVVDVEYGKYQGTPLSNGITQWLGMRYAAAPTGENRFAAPKEPNTFPGILPANKVCQFIPFRPLSFPFWTRC